MFNKYKKSGGFTLIELMVVMVVLAIIITLAAPSFFDAFERRRLTRAGEEVISAVRYARSEAVKQNRSIRIMFGTSGAGWCYGIDDTGSDCDCTADTTNCTVNGEEMVRTNGMGAGSPFGTIQLVPPGDNDFEFDNERGFALDTAGVVDNGTVSVQTSDGSQSMSIVVSRTGRVRIHSTLPGYPGS